MAASSSPGGFQVTIAAAPNSSGCVPLSGNGLRQPVRWQGGEVLQAAGGVFRLRVNYGAGLRPEDARLFALYVTE